MINIFKILVSNKCGQWFRHRFHYVNGYGVRCKYCDRTKLSTIGERESQKCKEDFINGKAIKFIFKITEG